MIKEFEYKGKIYKPVYEDNEIIFVELDGWDIENEENRDEVYDYLETMKWILSDDLQWLTK